MKIFHVIESIDDKYGGPAVSVPSLVFQLNQKGADNEIVSTKVYHSESNTLIDKYKLNWSCFSIKDSFFSKKFRYSPDLSKYLKKQVVSDAENIILHTHNFWNYPIYVVYKIMMRGNIPVVMSLRGNLNSIFYHKILAWVFFQKKMMNNAAAIHVTNKSDKKRLRDIGVVTRVAYIPNGIVLSEFRNLKSSMEARRIIRVDINKKYLLFMSRLHVDKGLDLLVNEWSKLAAKHPNWDLLVAGPIYSEKHVKSITQQLAKNKLSGRVKFLGMVHGETKLDVLAAADVLVLPSKRENFGIVIAEALACGLPVITTNTTPWEELRIYNAGWWIDRESTALANSLDEAMSLTNSTLVDMGARGKKLIKKYDISEQAKKILELYSWCLSNKSKVPSTGNKL